MKAMRKIIAIILIGLTGHLAVAQQVPFYSQYFFNPFVYNSSFTGQSGETRAFLTHRNQWTGIQGAPVTSALTIDGPLYGDKVGLGLNMYSDKTDILSRQGARVAGSYKLDINEEHQIRVGLGIGILNNTIDYNKAVVEDKTDPNLFTSSQSKSALDADFGLTYFWSKGLHVGVSMPQLLGSASNVTYNKVDQDQEVVYGLERHYIFNVGYDWAIDEKWNLNPLMLMRVTPATPFQFDIGAMASYEKLGWVGVMYRHGYAVGITLGGKINDKLYLGYVQDLIYNDLSGYAGASYELLVGYTFGKSSSDKLKEAEEKQAMKNQMDSLKGALKTNQEQTDKNSQAIDSLKTEINNVRDDVDKAIEEMQSAPPTAGGTVVAPVPVGENKSDGLSDDYLDNKGEPLPLGFYIVVGSYSEQKWARQAKLRFINAGFPDTDVLYNITNKFYNVFLSFTKDEEEARKNLKNARAEYPDAWLRKIQ